MQTDIHPKYEVATVRCACGNEFSTRSTLNMIKVDICSSCHPFFTGQQRLLDAAGRVERFGKRFSKTDGKTIVREKQTQKVISKASKVPVKRVLSSTPKSVDAAATKKKKDK